VLDHAKRHARLARCVVIAALALVAAPATASAADCPDRPTSMVFAPWGDTSDYFLAPGGDFEGASTAWTGGTLTPGNDPFYLAGGGDWQSLRVRSGATATSPGFCADVRHPDFRFVAQPLNPYQPGSLDVFVRFVDSAGQTQTSKMWTMSGVQFWTASPRVRLMRDLPLPSSGQTTARVLFKAVGGDWAIDDVFIDPFRR
jgi:hypothetical protein